MRGNGRGEGVGLIDERVRNHTKHREMASCPLVVHYANRIVCGAK